MSSRFARRGGVASGMTLLEVMVAVVLLATVFLVAVAALPAVSGAQRDAEREELASSLAGRVMERTRQQGYEAAASWSGQADLPVISGGQERVEHFLYAVQVSEVEADLKDVVLTVTWEEAGTERDLVLQTRLFSGGS